MNNIHMESVLKAGGAAAGVAIVLGLLSLVPFLGPIFGFVLICAGFLIPVGAGVLYGYFAPGREDTATSALGGALAGGASGVIFGLFSGFSTAVGSAFSTGLGDAVAGGTATALFCICGFGLAGLVLGAIGGVVWPLIQGNN